MKHSILFLCLFLVWLLIHMDEIYLVDYYREYRFKNTFIMKRYGKVVWQGPTCNVWGRRSVFNPSIVYEPNKERWHIFCRYTRGRRVLQCMYQQLLENDVVKISDQDYRESMFYICLTKEFHTISSEPVFVNTSPKGCSSPIDILFWQGEDPRTFRNQDGKLLLQATVHSGEVRKLAHGTLVRHQGKLLWEPEMIIQSKTNEKNWSALPLTDKKCGSQIFLSHVSPEWKMTTLTSDGYPQTILSTSKYETWFRNLRCTSPTYHLFPGKLLTCLHTYHPYRTVLCEIDSKTLLPTRLSLPLEFEYPDSYIEFPSGLYIMDDKVYIGVGVNDTRAKIWEFTKSFILNLLTIHLEE
jgi:predicted GH43/DUF377 family glycosyl hydrolase